MANGNDALFEERLDVFMEKSMNEIREFALRERRVFNEIRELVVDWHWKHMADYTDYTGPSSSGPSNKVKEILDGTSKQLKSLLRVAGRHSILLVVSPGDELDEGFLGGTDTGREFWLGMRNGGSIGFRNFKQFCRDNPSSTMTSAIVLPQETTSTSAMPEVPPITPVAKSTPAVALKNQLYVEMRNALRSACGIRNAEMKWSKQGKLSTYGVALIGWPRELEYKNPSRMSSQEMTTILALLRQGTLRFTSLQDRPNNVSKTNISGSTGTTASHPGCSAGEIRGHEAVDISWACNDAELDVDLESPIDA